MRSLVFLVFILSVHFRAWSFDMINFQSFLMDNNFSKKTLDIEASNLSVFRYQSESKTYCTGNYISKLGHVLTAAHCMISCFQLGERKVWKGSVINGLKPIMGVYATSINYPFNCQIELNGEVKSVRILSGPKGVMSSNTPRKVALDLRNYPYRTIEQHQEHKDNWLSAFLEGWGLGGDFLIFQIKDHENKSCLKLTENMGLNENYYLLSYPGRIRGEENINNEVQYSWGQVTKENYIPALITGEASIEFPYTNKHIATNIEAYEGSSGGALLAERDHKISGILSMTALNLQKRRHGRFIGVDQIRSLSGSILDSISCE